MTEDVINLGGERSSRSGNGLDWTPLEALRDLVQQIERGEINPRVMCVAMEVARRDGAAASYTYVAAGGVLSICHVRMVE